MRHQLIQPAGRSGPGRLFAALLGGAALLLSAVPASASPLPPTIELPDATSAEGIAAGAGSIFYAGDLHAGDIFRGDLSDGTAEQFIDAPDGRMAVGMKADVRHNLLIVAGGATGEGYVYNTESGETEATYQFVDPDTGFINDVALAPHGAWFTNSTAGELYFVPIGAEGELGEFSTLDLSGPAGEITGDFNLNGIASSDDGNTLVVAHYSNASLYTVDSESGESQLIEGLDLPNVDGILLEDERLWAVQNMLNQVSRITLASDMSSGEVEDVITSDLFQVPTTAARIDDSLLVVNAKFDTGNPPTAESYEVVIVDAFGNSQANCTSDPIAAAAAR